MSKPSFFQELQRRHVYKVGAAYAVGAWLLAQVITQVLPVFNVSMMGQRIMVLLLIAGFPVALVLSWIFDVTPEGIVRTDDLPVNESPVAATARRSMDRRMNYVLGLLLVLAVGYMAVDHFLNGASSKADGGTSDKSIAVLPFANVSGDPANEYFSDGLSDEMIGALGRLHNLKVIARSSSFQFKGKNESSSTMGSALGVEYLLEGSVRKSADRVRISVELVKAATGTDLWSDTYDRELKDIFAVQTEIADAVAGRLKITLLGDAEAPLPSQPSNQNLDAYNAYLQGNFYFQRQSQQDERRAIAQYEQAIKLDPQYALAYARLCLVWRELGEGYLEGAELSAAYDKALSYGQKALALDPKLGFAHYALGMMQAHKLDLVTAEASFRRAIELAPNEPWGKAGLSELMDVLGRHNEAYVLRRDAQSLDPLHATWFTHSAADLAFIGRYDEAIDSIHRAIELQPTATTNYSTYATIEIMRGRPAVALEAAQKEADPFWRSYAVAIAQTALKAQGPADAALKTLIETGGGQGPFQVASVYALRGQPNEMFAWMDRAVAQQDPGVALLFSEPFLMKYRDDPRFQAFCRKVGLPSPPPPAT